MDLTFSSDQPQLLCTWNWGPYYLWVS